MGKLLALLTTIKEILGTLKGLFDGFKDWSIKQAGKSAKKKIDEGFEERDQKPIEDALGHPDPGAPTKHNIPDLKTKKRVKKEGQKDEKN